MTSWAYSARTFHRRADQSGPGFSYGLFYLFLDIDRLSQAGAETRLFSINRPNIFSFYVRDHGDCSGAPLRRWAEELFRQANIEIDGKIMLLALPRVFGFVFNPLSIFFGYDRAGRLAGVLYEVRNTFGEKHVYIAPAADAAIRQRVGKALHVSPFFDVSGEYTFVIKPPEESLSVAVHNIEGASVLHVATLTGVRTALSDANLLRVLLFKPFMTIGVVAAIHWQALKIWLHGARYRRKPQNPPAQPSKATLMGFSAQTTVD